jgi:hypothetical protein
MTDTGHNISGHPDIADFYKVTFGHFKILYTFTDSFTS